MKKFTRLPLCLAGLVILASVILFRDSLSEFWSGVGILVGAFCMIFAFVLMNIDVERAKIKNIEEKWRRKNDTLYHAFLSSYVDRWAYEFRVRYCEHDSSLDLELLFHTLADFLTGYYGALRENMSIERGVNEPHFLRIVGGKELVVIDMNDYLNRFYTTITVTSPTDRPEGTILLLHEILIRCPF